MFYSDSANDEIKVKSRIIFNDRYKTLLPIDLEGKSAISYVGWMDH